MKIKSGMALYLAKLRSERGMTQVELGKKAKLPNGTVAQLEAGTKLFSDSRLSKLAAALGITVEEFSVGSRPIREQRLSPSMRILYDLAFPLTESERYELIASIHKSREAKLQE
jgi:transcriptional regulator with XRE-family HTH domain